MIRPKERSIIELLKFDKFCLIRQMNARNWCFDISSPDGLLHCDKTTYRGASLLKIMFNFDNYAHDKFNI